MISWPHLLVLFVVILLVFGTKKLRTLGSDLGESIKGFKKAMGDDEKEKEKLESQNQDAQDANFINKETQTTSSNDKKE